MVLVVDDDNAEVISGEHSCGQAHIDDGLSQDLGSCGASTVRQRAANAYHYIRAQCE